MSRHHRRSRMRGDRYNGRDMTSDSPATERPRQKLTRAWIARQLWLTLAGVLLNVVAFLIWASFFAPSG